MSKPAAPEKVLVSDFNVMNPQSGEDCDTAPVVLDRKAFLAVTTDPELVARIKALVKDGKSIPEAIEALEKELASKG